MASRPWQRLGCFGGLVFGFVLVFALTAVLAPWAFHIGGQFTPGFWSGFGVLRTPAGDQYPIYITFFPNFRSMTRLHLNGQRPISGLRGTGWLCSAQGVTQQLDLTGDMYGAFFTTDGNQMGIRLLDARRYFRIDAQNQRYFDIYGRWQGPALAMHDDGAWERGFHHDPHNSNARAQITFTAGSYTDFKNLCNATVIRESARIAPPRYQ